MGMPGETQRDVETAATDFTCNTDFETFQGEGILQCFGNITLELVEGEVDGVAHCRPEFENEEFGISYAPQGFVADGDDGSHWVIVDDRGFADCEGLITFNYGDHNLGYCTYPPTKEEPSNESFCGHLTCQGFIELTCNMGFGCHGADEQKMR